MPALVRPFARAIPIVRGVAASALLSAAILAGSLTAAQAKSPVDDPAVSPPSAETRMSHHRQETVAQRIASLHRLLKITPDEEADWANVAQAMRDNAASMQKVMAEHAAADPRSLTALDELRSYQDLAQAHVDGLKNLIASFDTLYAAMPAAQKKTADNVFRSFNQMRHPSRT